MPSRLAFAATSSSISANLPWQSTATGATPTSARPSPTRSDFLRQRSPRSASAPAGPYSILDYDGAYRRGIQAAQDASGDPAAPTARAAHLLRLGRVSLARRDYQHAASLAGQILDCCAAARDEYGLFLRHLRRPAAGRCLAGRGGARRAAREPRAAARTSSGRGCDRAPGGRGRPESADQRRRRVARNHRGRQEGRCLGDPYRRGDNAGRAAVSVGGRPPASRPVRHLQPGDTQG